MIVVNFAAPTGILDDHELATIWGYQPVHAGWISPLDAIVRRQYNARKQAETSPMVEEAPAATAGTRVEVQIPYASVSDMQGVAFGNPGVFAGVFADTPQDLTEIVRLQQSQATMQFISTGAIVVIALTAVISALAKSKP